MRATIGTPGRQAGNPRLPAFLLAVVLALIAGAAAAQTTAPTAPEGAIEVGENAISDAEIRNRIQQVLAELVAFERVQVSVASGVVTLEGIVMDSAAEEELSGIIGRVQGVVAIENELQQNADLNERLAPALDRVMGRGERILVNAPIFLVSLGVFAVISGLGWMLASRLSLWRRLAPNSFIADIYRAVARIAFLLLGLVIALDILNATALIGAVLGAAGVVGLAVGFAVRDTVENFIASILLSLRQPFRPNDFVEIDGDQGNVARLTSRATILISPDGNHIRIPNATVYKGRIVNYTRDSNRRFTFDLGVDADADLAAALSTSVAALEGLAFVLRDPPVSAWISDVGESNVVLTFAGWVDQRSSDFQKARGEAIRATKTALEGAGFGLPEPIYRLRIENAPEELAVPSSVSANRPVPDADLPQAATPEIPDQATEEAVDRERKASDAGTDLLSEGRGAE
ncbi:mechanosensitive ion channel domain-containing protein [Tropicimonas aquimaris]|uniref:Small-conductance mechanosensitive channel n=1 Tax=Tropicimonas aquimaris TaxID=914152 RepID=A0ABW3IW12_9RHOB